MLQPPRPLGEAWLKLVMRVTLPSRADVPEPLIWVMVLLPPLLVLRRVGGARSPSISSRREERGYCQDQVGLRTVPAKDDDAPCSQNTLWRYAEPWPQHLSCVQSWMATGTHLQQQGGLPALWLPVGSSTRPVGAWPRPSLISMVNVVFILVPGSAVLTATGSRALGFSEQAAAPPAAFSRGLAAKPRPLGPSPWGQL